jgi:hypothetical protein
LSAKDMGEPICRGGRFSTLPSSVSRVLTRKHQKFETWQTESTEHDCGVLKKQKENSVNRMPRPCGAQVYIHEACRAYYNRSQVQRRGQRAGMRKRLLLWGEPSVRERNKNFVLQSDMPECGEGNDCVGSPHYKAIYGTGKIVWCERFTYICAGHMQERI